MAEWKDLEPTTGDWEGAPVSDEWVWNGEKSPTVTTAKEYAEKACACADKASASEQNAEDYAANASDAAIETRELADRIFSAGFEERIEGKQDAIPDLDSIRAGAEKGATAIQSELDPTVPTWAKQPQKPEYTAKEVGALPENTFIPEAVESVSNEEIFAIVNS